MKTRREMLEDFVREEPGDSFSRYALALELEKEGRAPEAVAQLREVLARDRSYLAAYYHLGRLLGRQNQADEARSVYRQGLEVASAASDQKTRSEIQEALDMLD